jgi:hypothetical protein
MGDRPHDPIDPRAVRTHPLGQRAHRVRVEAFGRPVEADATLADFLDGLGDVLAVRELRGLARAIVDARRAGRPVVWALGGHVVKVGLAPLLIRLVERGTITGLVLNGAAAIHDWEIAAVGGTSEDVAASLGDGRFGLVEETGAEFAAAARQAAEQASGLGPALGERIERARLPHRALSLLAAARRARIDLTVHVAIGCDTVHQHPAADGAALGAATLADFHRLVALVGDLTGGVWVNCGSAVQLPEVFLKALATARNLGRAAPPFVTADLDMQRHYRTEQNVLRRPVEEGGTSFRLIGHHEINVPLVAAAVLAAEGRD